MTEKRQARIGVSSPCRPKNVANFPFILLDIWTDMSIAHVSTQVSRYVALDVHRSSLVGGAVDNQQHIVLSPHVALARARFATRAPTSMSETDSVGPGSECQCLGALRSTGTACGPGHRGPSGFR
ncbi:MAG: hypothetical protein ACXVCM_03550 [Ktedonobacteraceae bacterium]